MPADALLGAEGRGYGLGLAALDRLRPTVAAAACGMAARALAEALAHVRGRQQFGSPLADFQLVQQKLARMATDLAAARLLTYRAAYEKDQGQERITTEAAMAKSFATSISFKKPSPPPPEITTALSFKPISIPPSSLFKNAVI